MISNSKYFIMNRIYSFLKVILFLAVVLTAFQATSPKPTKLFNGKNFEGWYGYTSKTGKVADPSKLFRIENGVIRLQGKYPGYVATTDTFCNYKLSAEFCWETDSMIPRCSDKRNSGLMYNVPYVFKDTSWPEGIQFQIKENNCGDFILLHNVTMKVRGIVNKPDRSVVIPKLINAEKKAGEWNRIEIVILNGECIQYLNGKLVNEGTNASVKDGRILLQYEGYPVKFRNIELTQITR